MKSFLIAVFIFAGIASALAISPDELGSLKLDAGRGNPDAIIRLAECYERGDGVPADKMTALAYYLVAFKKDSKNEALKKRIAALGGERFLPGGGGVSGKQFIADLGGVKLELVEIPAGAFTMGSPESEEGRDSDESRVRVRITEPLYLGKTEVTQAQWKSVMGNNPSYFKGDNLPVEKVSWEEAMDFCRKLTEREHSAGRLPRGWKYTLPTEAQWEYACRAGTTTRFSFGNSDKELYRYGNFYDRSGDTKYDAAFREKNGWKIPPDTSQDDGFVETAPVGRLRPNAWGLYDMHGNVWEWCLDYYNPRLAGGENPSRTTPGSGEYGSRRVIRGGGWSLDARDCRPANRGCYSPGYRSGDFGFRVALVRE